MYFSREDIHQLFQTAMAEDCPVEDVTTTTLVPESLRSSFTITAKEPLVACGVPLAVECLHLMDPSFLFSTLAREGSMLQKGELFLAGEGPARALLTAERSVLNIIQRLSGVATLTRDFVSRLQGTNVRLLDTRKTTPGLRLFEKYAVHVGGGINHRMGLSDMVLVKENHLAIAAQSGLGTMAQVVTLCRKRYPELKIEVEVQNVREAREAAAAGPDRILLDNMTPLEVGECVALIQKRAEIEVSGRIHRDTIASYALPGVDFISVGAVTHSAPAADLSLLIAHGGRSHATPKGVS